MVLGGGLDAVRCAVGVQREMAARNAGVQAERRIDFRIGRSPKQRIVRKMLLSGPARLRRDFYEVFTNAPI